MSVDALLSWQRKHHGYVAPSRHHLAYPPLWHNATDIEVYCHFCERGLLTLDYFSEEAGGGGQGCSCRAEVYLLILHWRVQELCCDMLLSKNAVTSWFPRNLSVSHESKCMWYCHKIPCIDCTLTNPWKQLHDGCTSSACGTAKGGRGMKTLGDAHGQGRRNQEFSRRIMSVSRRMSCQDGELWPVATEGIINSQIVLEQTDGHQCIGWLPKLRDGE